MNTINPAGYFFYWRPNSPFIEVFRKDDPVEAPYEVIDASDLDYSQSSLNKIANELKEYTHA